ncbi:hypothetical protein GCM10009676_39170 [Prauserella halophila]|uniref:3,4-dihydroxy-2-butanone-4-phosphate synthase n=1 Tax=Prauserella halophila TaxID=185641 RepID=A0ABN1WHV6_9PSEU|nr:3,4-dihydroxy-2-butanone-4-phosphate synthase [Prauserella halophila]MCP2238184.1 3,4-dihydroxy 2-butanone 4-phosphate synthase / GTP cyclohydrolase II [Prauserella halophila]
MTVAPEYVQSDSTPLNVSADDAEASQDTLDEVTGVLAAGKAVVLVDDLGQESECHLLFAARYATPGLVSTMVRHTSGFIQVSLPCSDADRLALDPMPAGRNAAGMSTYGVAFDAAEVPGTGISATDRAHTIALVADPHTAPERLTRPGHVMTYRAHEAGLLGAATIGEAATDLVGIAEAGFAAAHACLVSTLDPTRSAKKQEIVEWAGSMALPVVTVSSVLRRRLCSGLWGLPGAHRFDIDMYGRTFRAVRWSAGEVETTALTLGDPKHLWPPEVHQECVHSLFDPNGCDCRTRLVEALRTIAGRGNGTLLYRRRSTSPGSPLG